MRRTHVAMLWIRRRRTQAAPRVAETRALVLDRKRREPVHERAHQQRNMEVAMTPRGRSGKAPTFHVVCRATSLSTRARVLTGNASHRITSLPVPAMHIKAMFG
eukprot:Opistho-1_new@59228